MAVHSPVETMTQFTFGMCRPEYFCTSLTGHTDLVDSLAFSPDGKQFASGSRDGTILLWKLTKLVADR